MPVRTVYLETFGCQMNELDSDLVTGQLRALGYAFTPDAERADIVLYNTCSVRDLAEQKVRSRLGEMAVRKNREPHLVVGVLGCMAERDGESMLTKFPVVDVLCGPAELDKLPGLLDNAAKARDAFLADQPAQSIEVRPGRWSHPAAGRSAKAVALQGDASRRSGTLAAAEDRLELLDLSRTISASDHNGSAYVRITRGCNKFCTYCVVPHTRGAEVHRPPNHIIEECKRLADAGIIEITLLGQTVNHYRYEEGAAISVNGTLQPQKGRTYKGGHRRDIFAGERVTTFADLLHRIHEEVPAIQRLRFVTSYPRDFGDDVLQVMRDSPRMCRYLHVPAQSGSNEVLKRMNRGYSVEEYLEFVDRARHFLHQPEIDRPLTVAGDIIVGFCGETEADYQATVRLLERARYKNCFIFKYSPRPGTVAFDRIADDVPDAVKKQRCNDLLAVQHRISDEIAQEYVGSTVRAFVEGVSVREARKRREPAGAPQGMVGLTIGGQTAGATPTACDPSALTVHTAATDSPTATTQLTGRTDGDLIVVFDTPPGRSPADLIGRILPIRIDHASVLTMHGHLVSAI